MMRPSISIICPSSSSQPAPSCVDKLLISESLNEQSEKVHPLPNPFLIMPECCTVFPAITCLMDYTLDEAILVYRQLFYSTNERKPSYCKIDSWLDHIANWTLNSTPVVIDYGGAFEVEHLHVIQLAFPQTEIYSIDTLYEELDLLICNINSDETKWCIIPVFHRIAEKDQLELIESLRQEMKGTSSFWNGIEISEFNLYLKIDNLLVYDPYVEVLGMKKINFIDSTEKCESIPCSVFMAYDTYNATPYVDFIKPIGLIDRVHTKFDMDYAMGPYRFSFIERQKYISQNSTSTWQDIHTQFKQLKALLSKAPKALNTEFPSVNAFNWPNADLIAELLSNRINRNKNDSMAYSFGARSSFLQGANCLNLSSRMVENKIDILNPSTFQQLIEQHMNGLWKDIDYKDDSVQKYPKYFNRECLHEIVGLVANLHIHIDSYKALYYSFHFIRQLKYEDPNLHIEISLDEKIRDEPFLATIGLVVECNQNYVLVHSKLESFLKGISECKSIEEITTKVESSVAFSHALSQKQAVHWHRDLSFIYVLAYQDSSFIQVQDNLLKLNLQDLNFIRKKFEYMKDIEPLQCQTNQAVICFNFFFSQFSDYSRFPFATSLIDQWVLDKTRYEFTGPIITVYPNASKLYETTYPKLRSKTDIGSVYNLLIDKVPVLIQWRN
ncbi:unnamed protein product [Rotaria sp. Silwood2]|nr:unnamed protein product [Rotaria sp. Silwood2]CAF4425538.1 unnamed protein product [Rotaria sp. Silwood2]